jgi:hypothetical protein
MVLLSLFDYSFGESRNKFMSVSATVAEKCSVESIGSGESVSKIGVKVNCVVDTPYAVNVDALNVDSYVERKMYDGFTDQFHSQLFIENNYCKEFCNNLQGTGKKTLTTGTLSAEFSANVVKITILW